MHDNPTEIQQLVTMHDNPFSLKDLGDFHSLLGIRVETLTRNLFLHQKKYIMDILEIFHMSHAKAVSTPMSTSSQLTSTESDLFDNPTLYRSIEGGLQYATLTRPDLAFSINKVCQFMSSLRTTHWTVVKRIL